LLEDLIPLENLTRQVRQLVSSAPSPFTNDAGFDAFFDSLCRGLHRQAPRHALIIRERGVGERAALVELSRRSAEGKVEFLRDSEVWVADCRHLPAEARRAVIDAIFHEFGSQKQTVICLDGFASLLRSEAAQATRSALLWHLTRARCRVVGILTPHEYEEHFLDDAESHELFSIVHFEEPETEVALRLTRHYANGLEARYKVKISDEAVNRAVLLSGSYVLHERLPYKAVKVLRAICDDVEFERSQHGRTQDVVSGDDAVTKIAAISGIPPQTLAGVGEDVDYARSLGDLVVGQEHAVREVATELSLIKAGLVDAAKPASVMLFIGQTGTGKTELAKALARFYSPSKRLKTFTLGNFSEPHSVSGIIGVPPGYVGHDQGGRLVNELNTDPYSVFLLDEADKAHPDVMQPFLNLFDEGWIFDQRGAKAYADRAIFILTTNVGQRQIADMCKQGKSIEEITWTMKESLSRIKHTKSNRPVFTPEFLARVKRVIVLRSLDESAMLGIGRKLASQMMCEWQEKRQKVLRIDQSLIEAVARKAHAMDQKSQGKEGGRIVRKLMSDLVESRIQNAIRENPDVYRAAAEVHVMYQPADGAGSSGADTAVVPEVLPTAVHVSFDK
jgi:ATP-dependent Clp protease ATP-binding subunit ClpA